MPEPEHDRAGRPAGRGRLRASHADRDQVVDTLKDAFVQGRLTKDEFDSRVGYALASRTQADLAALTADLPVGPPAAQPRKPAAQPRKPVPARPRRPENPTVKRGVRVMAVTTTLTAGVWGGAIFSNAGGQEVAMLIWAFTFLWFGIMFIVGSVMLDSVFQRRPSRQLPPSAGGPPGGAGDRGLPADPAGSLRPGDQGRQRTAEASWRPRSRPSLLGEPHLNPS